MRMNALEALLEDVVGEVTGKSVSVAILGNEVSINVGGERYSLFHAFENKDKEYPVKYRIREGISSEGEKKYQVDFWTWDEGIGRYIPRHPSHGFDLMIFAQACVERTGLDLEADRCEVEVR